MGYECAITFFEKRVRQLQKSRERNGILAKRQRKAEQKISSSKNIFLKTMHIFSRF
jgi:hypothetical protein